MQRRTQKPDLNFEFKVRLTKEKMALRTKGLIAWLITVVMFALNGLAELFKDGPP